MSNALFQSKVPVTIVHQLLSFGFGRPFARFRRSGIEYSGKQNDETHQ